MLPRFAASPLAQERRSTCTLHPLLSVPLADQHSIYSRSAPSLSIYLSLSPVCSFLFFLTCSRLLFIEVFGRCVHVFSQKNKNKNTGEPLPTPSHQHCIPNSKTTSLCLLTCLYPLPVLSQLFPCAFVHMSRQKPLYPASLKKSKYVVVDLNITCSDTAKPRWKLS